MKKQYSEGPKSRSLAIAFMAEKVHMEGGALGRLALMQLPLGQALGWLDKLPPGLVGFLGGCRRGHIVIGTLPSDYREEYAFKDGALLGVALLSVKDLGESPPVRALRVLGYLLDDLLGRGDNPLVAWLSEGGGAVPVLGEVGVRIAQLFPLGYGVDEEARRNPREYFAQSVALYFCDERKLNTLDPQMQRLLGRTIFAQDFWERMGTGKVDENGG